MIDRTPMPAELPGGPIFEEFYGEAEMIGGRHWQNATPDERAELATHAAVTARVTLAQVRSLGFDSIAAYIAATEDLEPLSGRKPKASAEPASSIGRRTAADLRHGDPPDQLADPFLTAEGPTVIYGKGGTGKGVTACWLMGQLVAAGHVVMLVDFEGHEREWGSRLRGLGVGADDLASIHYRAPFGPDWTATTGALSTVAELVRDDAARIGATYLVVDSYSVATSNGDTMGGEQAAREYFGALARIGLPSLTIAHVRGDSGRFPDRPFGSVFVHNLARETWSVERASDADDRTGDPFAPHVVELELRNKKSNARAMSPARFVTFSFFADGTIEATDDRRTGRSVADLAADALAEGPLTLAKLASAIREDTGQSVTEDALRIALKRQSARFVASTTGRPRTWSVR